jgi:large subunit ribosomal protein L29
MSVLNMSEIKGWDAKAIDAKVAELRKELFDLNMQKAAAGLEKSHLIKNAKKNIARLLTAKNVKGE